MEVSFWAWAGFLLFVAFMLALDLGIFHRNSRAVSFKEALGWSIVWVSLAGCFGLGIRYFLGSEPAINFFTGYLIEYSLSMDNIFVFVMIFTYFTVPLQYQHRVLFWGIIGAVLLRGILIGLGSALVREFHWILYGFGAFLVYSGYKMARAESEGVEPESNPIVKLARKMLPITPDFHGDRFFIKMDGKRMATPLFIVLLVVETSDVIFAVDSIPAIFAVTTDPFIVFTANIFAVMGLRSMYFLLAGLVPKFHYLNVGLSVVLSFVGVKMLIAEHYKIPTEISLIVIILAISGSIAVSLLRDKKLRSLGE